MSILWKEKESFGKFNDTVLAQQYFFSQYTVEPRSKAPAYKAMFTYKVFEKSPYVIFCSIFYIGSKA